MKYTIYCKNKEEHKLCYDYIEELGGMMTIQNFGANHFMYFNSVTKHTFSSDCVKGGSQFIFAENFLKLDL